MMLIIFNEIFKKWTHLNKILIKMKNIMKNINGYIPCMIKVPCEHENFQNILLMFPEYLMNVSKHLMDV